MSVEHTRNNAEAVVELRDATKRFGHVTAIDRVSLDVLNGTIFGFIGPSGCGKTTTVRIMIGNYAPTEGTVKVFGREPGRFRRAEQKRIGYMPQLFVLYPELTVWENLNFAASIYGHPLRRKKRLHELLDLVELSGHEKKLVRNISGGMQRRLSLATTLIHNPELIFLDEPTAGIDPVLRRKFWDHFHTLKSQGHTLFVTTQYVGEAAYCDYVGVLRDGRLLMVETPDDLRVRALGGHVVELRADAPLRAGTVAALQEHPLISGGARLVDAESLRLVVQDASLAIPQLIRWCQENEVGVESINEYVPPFDDIFVRLMEQEEAKESAA